MNRLHEGVAMHAHPSGSANRARSCQQADRLVEVAPRVLAPGIDASPSQTGLPVPAGAGPAPAPAALPAEQQPEGFEFQPLGTDPEGNLQFEVRLLAGGSPYLVADQKLTPLFQVDGKGPVDYVSDAYFAANPDRTARSIQPGDTFVLTVPPETFVVHWQQEEVVDLGGPIRFQHYVSEQGDHLRLCLTEHFPILYELEPADGSGTASLRLSPDLEFLLGTGRTDPVGLARLVYRVPDPDLYQVDAMRQLAASVEPGQSTEIVVDRTRTYLDPVREAMTHAETVAPILEPGREHLKQATFTYEQGLPYLAVEDALGTATDLDNLPRGQVFRIEYSWDGVVRVAYLTGADDGRGKRDPFQLRENERWAALYDRHAPGGDSPVAWGPGEPSDFENLPTARDPHRRILEGERSYDYLVPGRAILLTFRPTRTQADDQATIAFRETLGSLRDEYKDDIMALLDLFDTAAR